MRQTIRDLAMLLTGILIGASLWGGAALASGGVEAQLTTLSITLDGEVVTMPACYIDGTNYVKLRDIGEQVDFNVYWDDGVYIDSTSAYTGVAPAEVSPEVEAMRLEIAALTNGLRTQGGLEALPVDDLLMKAAQVRAEEMAAASLYSHTRPDGTSYHTVTDSASVGENIHRISVSRLAREGLSLPETAVDEWAGSESHYLNMMNSRVTAIGVGLALGVNESGAECWYCVQLFLYDGCVITWVDTPAA